MTATRFQHSGFFVIRTPLLPLEFMQTWARSDKASPEAGTNGSGVPGTAEEERLRARLRGFFDAPDLRDALFIASPAVEEALRRDGTAKDPDKRERLDASLTKYLMRMSGRCTPFGVFAGVSVGTFATATDLRLGPRPSYRRYTRIDMGYLAMLVDGLMRDPRVRRAVRYRQNSTLYTTGNRARYVEHRPGKRARSYFLVSADLDGALEEVLDLASAGTTFEALSRALARDGIELEEAGLYVDELIQGQVLEPDLAPAVTGGDPMLDLEEQLSRYPELQGVVAILRTVRERLATIDESGIGAPPQAYRDIAQTLKTLPADPNIDRLFQVDMAKPVERLALDESILEDIDRTITALQRLSGGVPADPLESFKKAFVERYAEREIPLLEALDDECGVGFGSGRSIQSDTAPLLAGLVFPVGEEGGQRVPWGRRQNFILRRLTEARENPTEPIRLTDEDVSRFPPGTQPLPNAFSVMFSLLPPTEKDGRPRLLWQGLVGPSGARFLGRFCHTDPGLLQGVREHLRQEELLDPDRLYCEIVHLPEGRIGNVIARPLLRDHELVFLARAGTPEERQIALDDLLVSVRAGRVVLRSKRLGREIVPRLTNAHNISLGIGVYRFLGLLQSQESQGTLGWSWTPFDSLPFLPRVELGNTILSAARWIVPAFQIRAANDAPPDAAKDASTEAAPSTDPVVRFQEWALENHLPRWFGLREGDNVLPVDRDNLFSVRAMLDAVDKRPSFELVEMPWLEERGIVSGPEGTFTNEVIIPLVRTADVPGGNGKPAASQPRARRGETDPSLFLPGSEWLFARWNTAPGYADTVLVDFLAPVIQALRGDGVAEDWFFIRYADPDFHVRLRIRGTPAVLAAKALPRLREAGETLLRRGLITKVTYDTYDRETYRYGGPAAIELCERIFGADSDAAVELVASTLGDEGAVARWRLTLCGMDFLLRDAGLDLEQRYFFVQRRAENFMREFRLQGSARHPIQDKFRAERKALLLLLSDSGDGASELAPGLAILRRRSRALEPLLGQLRDREERGELTTAFDDILGSLVHMHVNRMLPTAARAQEAVLYRFLENLYDSQLARAGKKKKDRTADSAVEAVTSG